MLIKLLSLHQLSIVREVSLHHQIIHPLKVPLNIIELKHINNV